MKERLQKILSTQGICSRRKAEEYIIQGAVKVNGIIASLGDSADIEFDEITVFDEPVNNNIDKVYIMLNKPRGYVTTLSDEDGRPTVRDLLDGVSERVYPVGRLDMYSEGLLIMTNDGKLANKLTHPSHEIYKTYLLNIGYDGAVLTESADKLLSRPMTLDGVKLIPARCKTVKELEDGCILTVSIRQGKNRQIRRMCAHCGFSVRSLKRIAVGKLPLGDLESGKYRYLTNSEVEYLRSL